MKYSRQTNGSEVARFWNGRGAEDAGGTTEIRNKGIATDEEGCRFAGEAGQEMPNIRTSADTRYFVSTAGQERYRAITSA